MEPVVLLDAAGRRRSAATMPGHRCGQPPRNRGMRYPLIHRQWRRSCWSCARPAIGRKVCDARADRGDVARGLAYQRGARADRERS
jgi:hypothetical protein